MKTHMEEHKCFFDSISCIFYDFDGVMTNNYVMLDQNGVESVFVNRSDGLAVAKIKSLGIPQVIVSTEKNPIVRKRAEKLDIPALYGVVDKGEAIKTYADNNGIKLENAIFIGNDINDLTAFRVVGIKGAPADAQEEILDIADWVSTVVGGHGVIRDLYRNLYLQGNK